MNNYKFAESMNNKLACINEYSALFDGYNFLITISMDGETIVLTRTEDWRVISEDVNELLKLNK
jgi:hypothetical protein